MVSKQKFVDYCNDGAIGAAVITKIFLLKESGNVRSVHDLDSYSDDEFSSDDEVVDYDDAIDLWDSLADDWRIGVVDNDGKHHFIEISDENDGIENIIDHSATRLMDSICEAVEEVINTDDEDD